MAKPGSQRQATIDALKERIARDPLSRAFLQLAEEYRRDGRYKEAVEVCLEGLARHPTYHTARISLGRTYLEAGDLANARRAFSDVVELQPENHLAGKLLAEVQKKMGDTQGAAATYRAILSQYPNDREVETLLRQVLAGPSPTLSTQAAAPVGAAPQTAGRSASPPATGSSIPAAPAPVERPRAPVAAIGSPAAAASRPLDPAPDFRAEDLGAVGLVGGELSVTPGRPARSPGNGSPTFAAGEDDALQTNTLAELYLRQGLVDRAIEVYRGMLRVDPGHLKAARRLSELESAGAVRSAAVAPGPAAEVRPAPAATPGLPPAPMPAPAETSSIRRTPPSPIASVPPPAPPRDRRIVRLERWLDGIRAAAAREARPR